MGTSGINLSANISLRKWTHIAAVKDGSYYKLFIDGKLEASGTWQGSDTETMPNDTSRGVDIGRRRC